MEKIRIGVVGVGLRGVGFAENFIRHGGFELAAVCDSHAPRLDVVREFFAEDGVNFRGGWYTKLDEFLDHPDLQAVYVCTPDNAHAGPAIAALDRGLHVLCEKPLAITMEDCRRIAKAAKCSKGIFYLGFNLRHLPLYEEAREMVRSGRLGNIHMMRGCELYYGGGTYFRRWNRFNEIGGGMFVTKLTHDFDIMNYVCGRRPLRVAAFGGLSVFRPDTPRNVEEENQPYASVGDPRWSRLMGIGGTVDGNNVDINVYTSKKDTVDNAVIILEYPELLHASYIFSVFNSKGRDGRELEIIGDRGHAIFSWFGKQTVTFFDRHSKTAEVRELACSSGGHGGCDQRLVERFYEAIANGAPVRASWEDGMAAVAVGLAARNAQELRQVVEISYG